MFNNLELRPMLLKETSKPFNNQNYLFELKYDGIRVLLFVSNKEFKIITRNGIDVSDLYPELKSIQKITNNKKIIFDGEIIAFKNNLPSFQELQKRSHLKNKAKIAEMINEIPVCFIAFDILYQNKDLTNYPLINRKKVLDKYPNTDVFMKTQIYSDGIKLFKKVKKLGLEGIVAKEKNSIYIPNKRVDSWLKIKNFCQSYFYVHGYVKLKEKYRLLLGEYHHNILYMVGNVSIMPNNPLMLKLLQEKKHKCLFQNFNEYAIYIKPKYKIKVNYLERTNVGTLRQPVIAKTD